MASPVGPIPSPRLALEAPGGTGWSRKGKGEIRKAQNWKRLAEHTHPIAERPMETEALETAPVYMDPESGGAEMRTQVYGSHPGLSLHHIVRLLLQGRPGERRVKKQKG